MTVEPSREYVILADRPTPFAPRAELLAFIEAYKDEPSLSYEVRRVREYLIASPIEEPSLPAEPVR